MRLDLRKVARFAVLALIAGVIASGTMRVIFILDPMVLAARTAIAGDTNVKRLVGDVHMDDVSVFHVLKTGDESQAFAREEYSASVSGSEHDAIVKVLIKKSYVDGGRLGSPEIIDIKVRE